MRIRIALAVVALLLASGCGADRPSRSEIEDAVDNGNMAQQLGMTTEQAQQLTPAASDCVADALENSDLTNQGLRDLVDGVVEVHHPLKPADSNELDALADDIKSCLSR